jgi:hypothetical protein
MKDNNSNKDMDWKNLSIKLKSKQRLSIHTKIITVMPQHPPERLLSSFTEGIYPSKEMLSHDLPKKEKN